MKHYNAFPAYEHKKRLTFLRRSAFFCRGGRIRTYDLVVPNDARYRAALHPENNAVPMGRLRVGNSKWEKFA